MRHRLALPLDRFHRSAAGAVGTAPAKHQEFARFGTLDFLEGDVLSDVFYFLLAKVDHLLVVVRIVTDIPGDILFLQAADAMHQAGGPRDRPGPGQVRIPLVRQERLAILPSLRMARLESGEAGHVGNPPRLGAVGDVAVGQQEHGHHELDRDPPGFLSDVETIGWAAGGQYGEGAFAIAAEEGLQQIRLLGFGRQSRAGPPPLHVHNHHRQLGHHRQANRFPLQGNPGTAGGGHPHRAGEGRPDGRADGGDFVFRLKGPHPKILMPA